MTISTTQEAITPLDKGEGSLDLELRSFPPADDAIDFIKQVDWQDVGLRTKNGVKNLLLLAAAISEKSFDFHIWLAKKLG